MIELRNGSEVQSRTFSLSDKSDGSAVNVGGSKLLITGAGTRIYQYNVSSVATTGRGRGNVIEIRDGATFDTIYNLRIGSDVAGEAESGHSLVIGPGSTMGVTHSTTAWRDSMIVGDASYGNTVDVYGTYDQNHDYCRFKLGVGAGSHNNVVTVYGGGVFQYKGSCSIGYGGSHNQFVVKSGGTFSQLTNMKDRDIFLGEGENADYNSLTIEPGGVFSAVKPVCVGLKGSHNRFDYANPTFLPAVSLGVFEGTTDNTAHLHGDGSQEVAGNLSTCSFGTGTVSRLTLENFTYVNNDNCHMPATKAGNKLILRKMNFTTRCTVNWSGNEPNSTYEFDETTWSHYAAGSQHRTLLRSPKTTLRFLNGSSADLTGCGVYLGDAAAADGGETVEVTGGSSLTFNSLFMHNSNNRFLIADSTVNINESFLELSRTTDKYSSAVGAYSTNLVFRFEGAVPKLTSSADATFAYVAGASASAKVGHHLLEFVLPDSPYAEPPIQAKSITLPKTTKLHVFLEGRPSKYVGEYVIARATGPSVSDTISVSDLDELGSELPNNCKVSLSDDQKQLLLRFSSGASILAW